MRNFLLKTVIIATTLLLATSVGAFSFSEVKLAIERTTVKEAFGTLSANILSTLQCGAKTLIGIPCKEDTPQTVVEDTTVNQDNYLIQQDIDRLRDELQTLKNNEKPLTITTNQPTKTVERVIERVVTNNTNGTLLFCRSSRFRGFFLSFFFRS